MKSNYLYLLINFFTILFPLLLSFDKKVQFFKSWRYVFPSLFLSGLLFLLWDCLFTITGVWSFNENYILGIAFFDLPLEEILFFITVPFACIFIYECLNFYIKKDFLQPVSHSISWFLIALSIVLLIFYFDRIYTLVTFMLLPVLVGFAELRKVKFLGRFYLAFIVSLLPFYIVNGVLTSLPIVLYNNSENMAIRIGTIPFEDHFYSLSLILLNILFFEHFKKKGKTI
ncbi:lycopene cyclase domain-containing protein [Rubrolithibacter danxiaensis]|uniref:lycopene cyclase domain-containing protein n=1 Tax=Rubrolithibacter danxiaensis TaxID=3390805 RepID=UPI003BF8E114